MRNLDKPMTGIFVKSFYACVFFGLMLISSCGSTPDPLAEQTYDFFASYNNASTGIPTLTINTATLPSVIKITNTSTLSANCAASRVCLAINSVRFSQSTTAYQLVKAETYESNSGQFIIDVENKLVPTQAKSLDFVLVLDFSSSLGADQAKVKQYANDFITQISVKAPDSRVGIVVFSQNIETLALTNDFSAAKSFISTKTGVDETRLFEAIDSGLKLLTNSSADGKALVVFTDGINNSWSDPQKYQSNSFIINRLNQPINGILVSSFAIGLSGSTPSGALTTQLNQLALNGGTAEVAENGDVLKNTFTKFANSVSAVYTLTYDRNSSKTSSPISLNFRLTLKPLQ